MKTLKEQIFKATHLTGDSYTFKMESGRPEYELRKIDGDEALLMLEQNLIPKIAIEEFEELKEIIETLPCGDDKNGPRVLVRHHEEGVGCYYNVGDQRHAIGALAETRPLDEIDTLYVLLPKTPISWCVENALFEVTLDIEFLKSYPLKLAGLRFVEGSLVQSAEKQLSDYVKKFPRVLEVLDFNGEIAALINNRIDAVKELYSIESFHFSVKKVKWKDSPSLPEFEDLNPWLLSQERVTDYLKSYFRLVAIAPDNNKAFFVPRGGDQSNLLDWKTDVLTVTINEQDEEVTFSHVFWKNSLLDNLLEISNPSPTNRSRFEDRIDRDISTLPTLRPGVGIGDKPCRLTPNSKVTLIKNHRGYYVELE